MVLKCSVASPLMRMLWEVLDSQQWLFKANCGTELFLSALLTKWLYRLAYASIGAGILDVFYSWTKACNTKSLSPLVGHSFLEEMLSPKQMLATPSPAFHVLPWEDHSRQIPAIKPLLGCCISLQVEQWSIGRSLQRLWHHHPWSFSKLLDKAVSNLIYFWSWLSLCLD